MTEDPRRPTGHVFRVERKRGPVWYRDSYSRQAIVRADLLTSAFVVAKQSRDGPLGGRLLG